jgi:hypothetical protein
MAITINSGIQAAIAAAVVSAAGSGAVLQHRSGVKPASLGTATGTLLATHTWTGVPIGTASGNTVDFDEAGAINVAGSNVSGTPTWARLMTSGSVVVMDFDYGAGTNNIVKTSDPVTGQPYTLSAWSIAVPATFS